MQKFAIKSNIFYCAKKHVHTFFLWDNGERETLKICENSGTWIINTLKPSMARETWNTYNAIYWPSKSIAFIMHMYVIWVFKGLYFPGGGGGLGMLYLLCYETQGCKDSYSVHICTCTYSVYCVPITSKRPSVFFLIAAQLSPITLIS